MFMISVSSSTMFYMLLLFLVAQSSTALQYPLYTFQDHPFYTDKLYSRHRPAPVVVRNYYRRMPQIGWTTRDMAFVPAGANYWKVAGGQKFGSNLDALYIPRSGNHSKASYVRVTLNHEARVFLLLNAKGSSPPLKDVNLITGLDGGWRMVGAVRTSNGKPVTFAERSRLAASVKLPNQAMVVEKIYGKDEEIILPHPGSVTLNGQKCHRFTLLFAQPDYENPKEFRYPVFPSKVLHRTTNREIATTPVRPNARCPVWLHDLHVAPSRDLGDAKKFGERNFWRTWHPQIDPIFWCYYDHEHGVYPGKYRPLFHYTAFKTPDADARNRRQQESHNGFKTFAFPVPEEKRFVVMVVHLHLSRAHRLHARLHTVIFAVLDSAWNLEMELQMKMDFGAAVATLRNGTDVAINANQRPIMAELERKGVFASRRFNVLNVDSKYPDSVDTGFLLNTPPNTHNMERVLDGIYEQWTGPLNSCSRRLGNGLHRGFRFDTRDPSTALRYVNATTDASMQRLRGFNAKRFVRIPNAMEVGPSYCEFGNMSFSNVSRMVGEGTGVFHTDSYFLSLKEGGGRNAVRQFIKPGFKPLTLRKGILLPVDVWHGHLGFISKEKDDLGGRRSENIENAVNRYVN